MHADVDERISLEHCQCALQYLGYAQNFLMLETLRDIVVSIRERSESFPGGQTDANITIDFEEFCILTSYLTTYQQEITESGCISPIKGTNLPPPPIFLTNTPGWCTFPWAAVRSQ